VVAAVGADGSGKSRLTRDLESWLGRKLVVHHVYFGQPKSGVVFKVLNKPGSLARRGSGPPALLGAVARYTDGLKWLTLARRRRRLASWSRARASQGEVVIAERFPLPEFFTMETPMDGPRLQAAGPFAGSELRIYREIGPPDLTLVLDTDVETLRARKVDLTLEEHQAKVEAVQRLTPSAGRVFIDAGRTYEQVLLVAKTAVWEAIRAGG
jgi:thymidylate kinase